MYLFMFSEKNNFPRTVIEARKVAGSTTVKQCETVLSFEVSFLFSLDKLTLKTKTVCLFSLFNQKKTKSANESFSAHKHSSPKLQSAPLIVH